MVRKNIRGFFSYFDYFLNIFHILTFFLSFSGILQPFLTNSNNQIRLKIDLFTLGDSRGFNLLFLAAESGNTEVVEFLVLNYGFDVNFIVDEKTPADVAYENGHFEALLALLKMNSKFPEGFRVNGLPDEVKTFVKLMRKFHENIKLSNFNQICEIIDQNPTLKHFYDAKNDSAPSAALKFKQFEIYQLLINRNVYLGSHEIFNDLKNELKISEKMKFDEIFENLPEDHILILIANSTIIEGDFNIQELSKRIPKDGAANSSSKNLQNLLVVTFTHLNTIPQIQIILKTVAASRNFHLIFNFLSDSIDHLDEPSTNGLFCLNGRIYFAVKSLLDPLRCYEVHGMIAHELCHLAMFLVFRNAARPYRKLFSGISHEEKKFEEISRHCDEFSESEELVDLVFMNYDEDQQHAELIVRIAQLHAIYNQNLDKLTKLKQNFIQLFDYYDNYCMPQMHRALPEIKKAVEFEIRYKNARKLNENVKMLKDFVNVLIVLVIFAILFAFFYEFPVYEWNF